MGSVAIRISRMAPPQCLVSTRRFAPTYCRERIQKFLIATEPGGVPAARVPLMVPIEMMTISRPARLFHRIKGASLAGAEGAAALQDQNVPETDGSDAGPAGGAAGAAPQSPRTLRAHA